MYRFCGIVFKLKKQAIVSNAVLVEERIVKFWIALYFRRRMWRRLFPKFAMAQYLFNHSRFFCESDDLHCAAAFRTFERIDFIHCLNERRPGDLALSAGGHGLNKAVSPTPRAVRWIFTIKTPGGWLGLANIYIKPNLDQF